MESTCRVTTPAKPAVPENGGVLYARQFLSRIGISVDDLAGKRLVQARGYRGFDGLANLGVDASTLQNRVLYACPWSGKRYYWMFPLGVVTDAAGVGRYGDCPPWRCRAILREEDIEDDTEGIDPNDFGGVVSAMLGHGYTEGTLPSDGCCGQMLATVPLDNGDEILVVCWVWFNK